MFTWAEIIAVFTLGVILLCLDKFLFLGDVLSFVSRILGFLGITFSAVMLYKKLFE